MDRLTENVFYNPSVYGLGGLGGYFLLLAKDAPMWTALVWDEDGYD
jgi:hypothetical protein